MGNKDGNHAYGGQQRSYSFPHFHGDQIPTSTTATKCPDMPCEQVFLRNSVNSTGNVIVGGERLAVTGLGLTLEPGDFMGWVPVQNLNLIWHKDASSSYLEYVVIY